MIRVYGIMWPCIIAGWLVWFYGFAVEDTAPLLVAGFLSVGGILIGASAIWGPFRAYKR
jgi:hypothetical protein